MADAQVEQVAKGLAKAQREAICKPRKGAWLEREQTGFPSELFGPRWAGFAHLSDLGLAVRDYLKEQEQ